MADQIKYSNLVQRYDYGTDSFTFGTFGQNEQGGFDKVRDELKDQYGWMSPYEYYYGSPDSEQSSVKRTTLMPTFSPQALGLTDGKEDIFSEVEAADKDNIPNWFWVDSLSNWCYIKATTQLFSKSSTSSTWAGKALGFLAGSSFINGDLVGSFAFEFLKQSAEGNLDEWYYTIPAGIISDAESATGVPKLLGALEANKRFSDVTKLFTVSGIISLLIKTFFNENEADAMAEPIIEQVITQSDTYNLSRNCLSLYMWNGYTRSWMPLKWMIEVYDRYTKHGNYPIIFETVSKIADRIKNDRNLQDEYLYTIISEDDIKDPNNREAAKAVEEYRAIFTRYSSSHDDDALKRDLAQFNVDYYRISNELERSEFMRYYIFDPYCVEAFQNRSPLNKLQTIATAAGNSWKSSVGVNCHWLENWGMWISLPNDSAKIKLYADNTFQLINRPYSNFYQNNIISRGNIHTNIGHPCFMRGNDDILWIAYWLRWTSGAVSISSKSNKVIGITTSTTTTAKGMPDISDKDIENWNSIIESMFQKHDDYGFEDWMINGNYGLSYSKFTIDEESPTAISSYEESELNPEKAPMVNTIDWITKNQMVLSLSENTVVNRDDKNGIGHVAKRWV